MALIVNSNSMVKNCILGLVISSVMACSDEPDTKPKAADKTAKQEQKQQSTEKALFDFATWAKKPVSFRGPHTAGLLPVIGLTGGTSSATLDYFGDKAIKQKLSKNETIFLNLIESDGYTEMTWFKPSDADSANIQTLGAENVERAYHAARAMLGETGGAMVKDMTLSKKGTTKKTHAQLVIAACESFFCRIVVRK